MKIFSKPWFGKEWPVLVVLVMLVLFTAGTGWLVHRQIQGDKGQADATGVGYAAVSSPFRPAACQQAQQPQANQSGGDNGKAGQEMALRNYCVAVRANELTSRNLVTSGWSVIIALLAMAFSVITLVIAIRTGRVAIDKVSD